MLANILVLSLDSAQFFIFDVPSLFDDLWEMTVSSYSSNFGHMCVPVNERFVIFETLPLLCRFDTAP